MLQKGKSGFGFVLRGAKGECRGFKSNFKPFCESTAMEVFLTSHELLHMNFSTVVLYFVETLGPLLVVSRGAP